MNKGMNSNKSEEMTDYRGVDINKADNNKNTKCLRQQDTEIINNNPRNGEGPNPEKDS